jgi:hypothetical protein
MTVALKLSAMLACLAAPFAGCAIAVSERYQYSCTLDDAQLDSYARTFNHSFPDYSFDSYLHGCRDGLAQGLLFRGGSSSAGLPPEEHLKDGNCARYADPTEVDPVVYVCSADALRYEVTFEDDYAYVYPLSLR